MSCYNRLENDREYAEWCLAFCMEAKIDVFVPRRGIKAISKMLPAFEEIGTKVLVHNDSLILEILNNKVATAKLFETFNICKVPHIEVATNVEEFKEGYARIKELIGKEERVCIKYSEGEGATSFRVIDDNAISIGSLKKGAGAKLSYEQAVMMLGGVESFDELIIMPYLDGTEISIDSLMTSSGFIGVPRYKVGSRVTQVEINEEIIAISEKMAEVTGITCPYNLQLRYNKGELYLLEVNTRMAGGTHLSSYAGVNIPYLAVKELLEQDIKLPTRLQSVKVTQIETPVVL